MKSPTELAAILARQWQSADQRERRFCDPAAMPIRLGIGRPSATLLLHHIAKVREHIDHWRDVRIGEVIWEQHRYRSAAESIAIPRYWQLCSIDEWAKASADAEVRLESRLLQRLLDMVDARFHSLLIRQRSLWRYRNDEEAVKAVELSLTLEPGVASGRPLRALDIAGIDSKFIERHRPLLTALLDLRFDKQASELGLTRFLDAADEGEHWLLVVPLSPGLLPFAQLRLRARELINTPLPASNILLIENERCLHLLPELPDTIAVLGSGLDLAWLQADWLQERRVGYWGDMDTWGLAMLARARCALPDLKPLLMDRDLFDRHAAELAVAEPVNAGPEPPAGLIDHEIDLYRHLLTSSKGRLEQERLPRTATASVLREWTTLG